MAKANQKEKKKLNISQKKEIIKMLNKGYKSLDRALDEIIKASEAQNLDILIDTLELAKKIANVYRVAHIAQFED